MARFIDELEASILPGQAEVWERLIDPECLFVDENGKIFDKPAMVADIQPHPPEVYADIVSRNMRINIIEHVVAIVSYDADEHETFYGHRLHAIYRSVFTWFRRAHGWRLIGGQTMALLLEPPSLPLSSSALAEYTGTYEVSPQLAYVITQRGHELWGGRIGQPAVPLKAEMTDLFFSPQNLRLRKVFLRDPSGKIVGFADRREGTDLVWKRR